MILLLKNLGDYFIMMKKVMSRPARYSIFFKQFNLEMAKIILSSIGIVIIISFFIGAVIAIQQYINLSNPIFPNYTIGLVTRDALILELCPTMLGLILAGKIGSSITSEIGTMRITEQIDALEIMGINSASFLILPKILVSVIFFPILIILSISVGIVGGWLGGLSVGVTTSNYIMGIQYEFIPFYVTYSLIKTVFFAFIITSVSAYYGYHTRGGAINVGKSSTKAVVYCCILILIFNYILTKLILSDISIQP